jgi:monoamine oxidase
MAELGGEWISANQLFVVDLAEELGVPMSDIGIDFSKRDLVGSGPIADAEHRRVASFVNEVIADLSDDEQGAMTAADLFERADDGSDAFKVLRNRIEGSAGVAANRIGVSEVAGDFGLGEATYVRVDGGNHVLAEAMASRLNDLRTGQPVEEIESDDRGVMVTTRNDRIAANGVVVAVPLPLISRLRFIPPLSTEMTSALDGLVMGTAAKLVVSTESQPPLLARQDGAETWWCWTGAGANGRTRKVVTAFAGTQFAIDAASHDWRDRLTEAVPEVRFGKDSVTVDWGLEEWSGGCYSALGPSDEILLGVFEKEGSVVFAGEHTLGAGTIDGAIESGEQAADRMGRFLARTTPSN